MAMRTTTGTTTYGKFIKVVINTSTKSLLCSQEIQRLLNAVYGGGSAINNFFD